MNFLESSVKVFSSNILQMIPLNHLEEINLNILKMISLNTLVDIFLNDRDPIESC